MFQWLDRLCQQILWSIVRLLVNHAEKCGVIRNWNKICQPIMIFLEGRKKMLRQNKPSSIVLLLVAAAAVVSVGYIMTLAILARAISRSYYSCHWLGMLWMVGTSDIATNSCNSTKRYQNVAVRLSFRQIQIASLTRFAKMLADHLMSHWAFCQSIRPSQRQDLLVR